MKTESDCCLCVSLFIIILAHHCFFSQAEFEHTTAVQSVTSLPFTQRNYAGLQLHYPQAFAFVYATALKQSPGGLARCAVGLPLV